MMESTPILVEQRVHPVTVLLAVGAVLGLFYLLLQQFGGLTLLRDYSCYQFYLPFGLGERGLVKITDTSCYQQLSESSELSQRAVYSDLFSMKQTLHNFKGEEQKTARTRLFGRVLQVQGPGHLAALSSLIDSSISNDLHDAFQRNLVYTDTASVNLADLIETTVFNVFSIYFYGPALAKETEFNAASKQHPRDLVNTLMIAKLMPTVIRSTVVNYVTRGGNAGNIMKQRLMDIITGEGAWAESPDTKSSTMLEAMIQSTKNDDYWTPESLSQAIMGIWLAASFQPWVNLHFILLKLCECPEYVKDLRRELAQSPQAASSIKDIEELPLLDSFFKEVFRTRPLDHLSVRRKALRPFKFSNGQRVKVGQVACAVTIDRMRDPTAYPQPDTFDARRFLYPSQENLSHKVRNTRLTDVSADFLSWGFGSIACPGRFLASSVMKAVLVQILTDYEFELQPSGKPLSWRWESFEMPSRGARILLRKRKAMR